MLRLIEVGAAELNLHDVAAKASVSKALIHYHFSDKDSLLGRMVDWCTRRIVERQNGVFSKVPASGAVDALWEWVAGELRTGDLRALVELGQQRSPRAHAAGEESLSARRYAMVQMVSHLFALLQLQPRVPPELLGTVFMAFVDGLAMQGVKDDLGEARAGFDVLWLAILTLAE